MSNTVNITLLTLTEARQYEAPKFEVRRGVDWARLQRCEKNFHHQMKNLSEATRPGRGRSLTGNNLKHVYFSRPLHWPKTEDKA